jgi:hypothetical protein
VTARNEITRNDVTAIVVVSLLIPFVELIRAGGYLERVQAWLDNGSYVQIANVIRFGGAPAEAHFWGLPAVIALIESVFPISGYLALVLI